MKNVFFIYLKCIIYARLGFQKTYKAIIGLSTKQTLKYLFITRAEQMYNSNVCTKLS